MGLFNNLFGRGDSDQGKPDADAKTPAPRDGSLRLSEKAIFLGLTAATKEQAIRFAGEQLVKAGCVTPAYIDAMLTRENKVSTYLGQSLAMPHGTNEAKSEVLRTGIVVCQYPDGVQFGKGSDEIARLVIGVAAQGNDHIGIISRLAEALEDDRTVNRLATTRNVRDFLSVLNPG
ncbi:MAG: PTS sugar transporter subunit IIA [Azospirillaceae bacterium]|nr:PTS sugar transporter subunit IIA [Azospirillaceae bacterium]